MTGYVNILAQKDLYLDTRLQLTFQVSVQPKVGQWAKTHCAIFASIHDADYVVDDWVDQNEGKEIQLQVTSVTEDEIRLMDHIFNMECKWTRLK